MKELFMILKNLREVEDVDYSYSKSYNTLFIIINDFNGFDDHSLDEHYSFNGINIQLSYSSEDI